MAKINKDDSRDDGVYVASWDFQELNFFKRVYLPIARWSLFIIYFWFGILKVFGVSPATPLVEKLFTMTVSDLVSFDLFLIFFGVFECVIGVLFLIRGGERIALALFFSHMLMTVSPVVFLPKEIWSGFLIPTFEGQFIIKNLALVSAALAIGTSIRWKSESL